MRKIINAIKQFFGGTEHELKSYETYTPMSEIDISEYYYPNLNSLDNPVMCGICGTTPAKYSVTTYPHDGPPYSHDYCRKCFTGPLAKEQIDAENPKT